MAELAPSRPRMRSARDDDPVTPPVNADGVRTAVILSTRSSPAVVLRLDDDWTLAQPEDLVGQLRAGGDREHPQPARHADPPVRKVLPIYRSHAWGHGWGRRGSMHRWGTFD